MAAGDEGEIEGVDDLYALDPADFTAARNALVKALKADGRKDDAAAVAALRKPPTTAWALNQVARTQPDLVEDALEAGAALRAATDEAMAGDPGALREATAADRAASGALVAAARQVLAGAGGAGADTKLAATVRAAVLDDDVAADLRRGTLTADHDRSGLGLGAELDAWMAPAGRHLHAVPDPPAERAGGASDRAKAGARAKAGGRGGDDAPKGATLAQRRAAEREAKEAAKRAEEERAEREAEDRAHRRLVNELRATASRAEKRAARLEKVAVEAEAEAADARSDADEAAAAAEEANTALADAEAEAATRRGD